MAGQSMKGRTCLVTGATSGIGRVVSLELAFRGAALVITGRSAALCSEVRDSIASATGNEQVEFLVADLSSQEQIRRLAAEFLEKHENLHVLVNNAGGIFGERMVTEDGLEHTFALNHIGYFLLTHLLLDTLKASAPARIISMTSGAHVPGTMDFDDLQYEKGWRSFPAYARSKVANILFTRELSRRLEGTGITANCVAPGFVSTKFGQSGSPLFSKLMGIIDFVRISPEKGADTCVWLATSPDVEHETGGYFRKRRRKNPSRLARDDEAARRLWKASEEMAGI
jgi:NAD(P)-dependent dehydrogenase (short-subunit alcohol dehydrogenase family)